MPLAPCSAGGAEAKNRPGTPGDPLAPGAAPLSLALSALSARLAALERRIEREPRWIPGPTLGEVCAVQQRLYPRTRGLSRRRLDRVEARILSELTRLQGRAA